MRITAKLIDKKNPKTYDDIDQMCRKMNLQPIDDEDRAEIERLARSGDTVYIALNPLAAEIYGSEAIIYGTDEDEVRQRAYDLAQHI